MDNMHCETSGSVNDDNLLVSLVLKNRSPSQYWEKPLEKRTSQTKVSRKRNWSTVSSRTMLSWLVHSGVVCLGEVIQLRRLKDDFVLNEGLIREQGLVCLCCEEVCTLSDFRTHRLKKPKTNFVMESREPLIIHQHVARSDDVKLKGPTTNLFMESGEPLAIRQLEAWSEEYKAKKVRVEAEEIDKGDDLCGFCGFPGEILLCDNCPATYHPDCLFEKAPKGDWYCLQCRCPACLNVVKDEDPSGNLKCSMCKHRYHQTCMKVKNVNMVLTSDNWFCGQRCGEVYAGLQSRIGLVNHLSGDISWSLLKCIDGDMKAHCSPRFLALKANINSKLATALSLMENGFYPMVDELKTKVDMLPQAVYNWGSPFNRLNFEGFCTAVLEKSEVIVCVASIRIHDGHVAELPFVTTCDNYRQQGLCRLLFNAIEEMLKSLKIKRLYLPAAGFESAETWRNKFGFRNLTESETRGIKKLNLMALPGSTWLIKLL